jgi:hypothetical protein
MMDSDLTYHIGLLNADCADSEALQLTTGQEIDISIPHMLQL